MFHEELKWGLEELGPHPVMCAGVEHREQVMLSGQWVQTNTALQSPSLSSRMTGLGQLAFLIFCVPCRDHTCPGVSCCRAVCHPLLFSLSSCHSCAVRLPPPHLVSSGFFPRRETAPAAQPRLHWWRHRRLRAAPGLGEAKAAALRRCSQPPGLRAPRSRSRCRRAMVAARAPALQPGAP